MVWSWWKNLGLPTAAGDIATMVYGQQDRHIFYRGSNGLVYHIFGTSLATGAMVWSWWKNSAPTTKAISPTMVYGQQQHIFYRGSNGLVYHIFWDHGAGFFWEQWSGPGGKTATPTAAGGVSRMVYGQAARYSFYSWKRWISLSYIFINVTLCNLKEPNFCLFHCYVERHVRVSFYNPIYNSTDPLSHNYHSTYLNGTRSQKLVLKDHIISHTYAAGIQDYPYEMKRKIKEEEDTKSEKKGSLNYVGVDIGKRNCVVCLII